MVCVFTCKINALQFDINFFLPFELKRIYMSLKHLKKPSLKIEVNRWGISVLVLIHIVWPLIWSIMMNIVKFRSGSGSTCL